MESKSCDHCLFGFVVTKEVDDEFERLHHMYNAYEIALMLKSKYPNNKCKYCHGSGYIS